MASKIISAQTGAKQFYAPDFVKYSQFVGGVNATHHALENYTPALNNYGRLFMVRPPFALAKAFADGDNIYSSTSEFMQFKHLLEYMNRSIQGFQDKTLEQAATPIQGGFAGRQFNTPTVTKEQTNEITIGVFEMDGMLCFDVLDMWMNIIGDENSGLSTYGGWISGGRDANGKAKRLYRMTGQNDDDGIEFNEAQHTAEFIYIYHDRSGAQVQRAVMLADCWPKVLQQGNALNFTGDGTHDNITYDITFNCAVYRGPIINAIANDLLKQYRIVSNSLNFNPELGDAVYGDNNANLFRQSLGAIPVDSATGTDIGNMPAFYATNEPKTVQSKYIDVNTAKLSGQDGIYKVPERIGEADKFAANTQRPYGK